MSHTPDSHLIQIVDAALAEANRRGGAWIACRPGCTQCCMGAFSISPSDVERLREGLRNLDQADASRAARIRQRAAVTAPENEDDPCPALDPETGACELYLYRPLTCRTFGPAIRINEDSVDVCELCYEGATDDQIAATRVDLTLPEDDLVGELSIVLALR